MSSERSVLKKDHLEEEQELLRRLLEQEGVSSIDSSMARIDTRERAPLSYAQKRLWFLDRLQPGSDFYNVVLGFEFRGELDVAVLERSLQEIVRRHGALRTRFVVEDGEPVQKIEPDLEFRLRLVDVRHEDGNRNRRKRAQEIVLEEGGKAFDLGQGPLLRGVLARVGEEEHILGLSMHHIVVDEWSLGVLQHEMARLYAAYAHGEESPLQKMPVQYADYAVWQGEWLKGEVFARQMEYWKKQLAGMPESLELPTDKPRPAMPGNRGRVESRVIGRELWEGLKRISRQEGATLFMTLLAAYEVLLLRYTGQADFGVGTPAANRNHVQTEGVIGFCLNTLVMRADLAGKPSFREVLERVRKTALEGYGHQDLPLEKLVEELAPERRLSSTPLFQVMFTLLSVSSEAIELPGVRLKLMEMETATSKCDLTLLAGDDESPTVALNYDTDLFDLSTVRPLLEHFERLLESALANPEMRVWELQLLTAAERKQLAQWNQTSTDYPREKTVTELFEAVAESRPEEPAVLCGEQRMSYGELDRRASQLARYLREMGAGPGVLVGLCVERSLEMVVALLGILKTGATYVPLDPAYPQERLKYMVEDAGAPLLVTQERLLGQFQQSASQAVCIDREREAIGRESVERLPRAAGPGDLAYVMYTSGSTGRPKGVAVTQRNVVRLVRNTDYVCLKAEDRIAQLSNIAFDAATFEIWGALLTGACLVLAPKDIVLSSAELSTKIQQERITVLFLTTALFNQIAREARGVFSSLRYVLFGGEQVDPNRVREVLLHGAPEKLLHVYGPTEGTTFSSWFEVKQVSENAATVPIGCGIANSQLYVLDQEMNLAPVGVAGELYIAGDGVARGYWNRPELTAEKFLPNSFATLPGNRLYRTGDRVRRVRDGSIEFLGRADDQVKLRGFRVELGEIEAALRQHTGIQECAVLLKGETAGEKRLVAYIVPAAGTHLETAELRSALKKTLPEYMIPSALIQLPELPLNDNGKIDRRALPEPDGLRPDTGEDYAPPRTPMEEMLVEIWAEILGVDRVGIHDNFFDMGGHSLLATRVMSRVNQAFQVELPLRILFEEPTVEELRARVVKAKVEGALAGEEQRDGEAAAIQRVEQREGKPLSYSQERLWFLDRFQPGDDFYNVPMGFRLKGELAVEALKRSLEEMVRRHEVLRTRFVLKNGGPVQEVGETWEVELPIVDLTHLEGEEREREARRTTAEEGRKAFDLGRGPLLHTVLLRLAQQEHVLLLTMHHIVTDEWSLEVLWRELGIVYEAYRKNGQSPLKDLAIQYGDYAVWQRQWLQGEVLERQIGYWKKQLEGMPGVLELPTDRMRPAVQSFRGGMETRWVSRELWEGLRGLSRKEGATIFMTLLAGYEVLLGRYTGQEDFGVGTPVANRNRVETEGLIGFFLNTLVMRGKVGGGASFEEVVGGVREGALGGYAHQDVPFERLVEELAPERDPSRSPVFQVMFTLRTSFMPKSGFGDLEVSPVDGEAGTSKCDLVLLVGEDQQEPSMSLNYNTDLFAGETARRMLGHYERLLEAVVDDVERRVWELPLLSKDEEEQLLEWNRTGREYPREKTVAELFEEQVKRRGTAVAVAYGREELSYEQLNRRANQVGHYLRKVGVGAEGRVGICVGRSLEMVVGMVGILKAGATYVPLDSNYPQERLKFVMEDTGIEVLLTREKELTQLPQTGVREVCLDRDWEQIAAQSETNPKSVIGADHLIYVMYTSGSAGQPKGVGVTQRNVVRLVKNTDFVEFNESEVALQFAPISFDAATIELWGALLNGGKLVVFSGEKTSLTELGREIKGQGVTTLWLTAGLFHQMVEQRLEDLTGVRQLLAGGDVLRVQAVKKVVEELPGCRMINGYGPTEGTTFTCCYGVERGEEMNGSVPIGGPIANTQVYVLDEEMGKTPVGVMGELYIGGDGVAREYWRRPELTAEKFVPNPHVEEGRRGGERLYRSGDRVRWLAGGKLEFLGRADQQVKVRGYRVELGEIEAALREHAGVRDCAVLVKGDGAGEKKLVAYAGGDAGAAELRSYAKAKLPEYMVPNVFVTLAELPLNANGKVDRGALPEVDEAQPESEGGYAAPRTVVEELLVEIWTELLEIERVGIHDNFFDLGGHSMLATLVMSRVQRAFKVELPVRILFEEPTIAELAAQIEAALGGEEQGYEEAAAIQRVDLKKDYLEEERELRRRLLEQEGVNSAGSGIAHADAWERMPISYEQKWLQRGELPLSYAQERLWFLDRLQPGNDFYNVPMGFRLKGELATGALRRSLEEIVRRHEVLRTRFVLKNGGPVQEVVEAGEIELPVIDLTHLEGEERERKAKRITAEEGRKAFDLSHGPLLRMVLLRLAAREHVLVATIHHIIFDEWSLGIFRRELGILYEAYWKNRQSPLEDLAVQYGDYAVWQRQWLQGKVLERQIGYWKKQLEGMPGVLELPTDRMRPAVQSFRGALETRRINGELWKGLKGLSRKEGATMFMTLLAGYEVLLGRYTGQEDFGVGTPMANRNRMETEGLIGFFLNTLVMRGKVGGGASFEEVVGGVREGALGGYAHQDVPFERLVEELAPERDLSRTPLYQVMFTLLTKASETLDLPGVRLSPMELEAATSKCDLTLMAADGEIPAVAMNYDTDLFDAETIQRMLGHYERLLEAAIAGPENSIRDLAILSESERWQLLVEWNQTETEYGQECVHELFEEQARRNPGAVAVERDGRELKYEELNRRANQLGRYLRKLGVGPEVRVGLFVERSLEMVVGLMGILKAGGAYVPLDPEYPAERLKFMMDDAGIAVLVTQNALLERLPEGRAQVVSLEEKLNEIERESGENVGVKVHPRNLAYVIYTSGSSGKPKGVAIEHQSASVFVHWAGEIFSTEELGGVLASTSICFDLSVFEIFVPLSWGGRTIVVRNALSLAEMERGAGVKLLNTVPSAMAELLRLKCVPERVRTVNLAGEALQRSLVKQIYEELKVERIFNLYGPSEDTTYSTYAWLRRAEESGNVPIGKPIGNTQAYVLDGQNQPAPVGIVGKLYLGGQGLARGYLNRPELTAEQFIPNPFTGSEGERMYRTGDLAKWGRDGNLEFLGRADQQVKLRGYRIELGEIEAALAAHAGVRACAVTVREDHPGNRRIVAYVVHAGSDAVGGMELSSYLRRRLPEYMIPSAFVEMEELPLTPNGKVDRKALPSPEKGWSEARGYVGPRNGEEEIMCGLFAEVLKVERAGVHDNFFELGGHSLLATRLVSRIRSTLGVDLSLRSVFESPTVAGLAPLLHGSQQARISLRHHQKVERAPLSHAQRRLWFINQFQGSSVEYNMPEALRLRGALDVDVLRRTIQTIVDRHDSLRTHFAEAQGEPVQIIAPSLTIEVPLEDLSGLLEEERQRRVEAAVDREWQEPFDLTVGPVLRVKLLKLSEQEHILLRTFHHIVSDGWSHGVFTKEFMALYEAYMQGRENPLPDLPLQYADFALWQLEWFSEGVLADQLQFWKEHLAGIPEQLEIPKDRPRPALQTFAANACGITLPAEKVTALKRCGQSTLYMTLLAAFAVLLHRYSGQDDIVVGSPIANRQDERLEGLIGFFVNTLVMRVGVNPKASFSELLGQVREMALEAYRHQDLPFERLVEELSPQRSLSRTPVFQVTFALQNASMEAQRLKGLEIEPVGTEEMRVRFDMEVHAFERSGGLEIYWVYNLDLFDRWRMEQMARHYERLLEAVVEAPEKAIRDLAMLSASETQQLVGEWSGGEADYPECCVHEVFEEQAKFSPEAVAVIHGQKTPSYRELNQRANQVAHYLLKLGVGPEALVGICIERSPEMIIALLAILKAGGVYVPLGSDLPAVRREQMIADAGLRHILTTKLDRGLYDGLIEHVITMDGHAEEFSRENSDNPGVLQSSTNAAYVNFTSGSTGQPKGVLVPHCGVVRLVCGPDYARFDSSCRLVQLSTLSFDAATLEIWGSLLNGGSLVTSLPTRPSLEEISELICRHRVNTLFLTAGLFREVVDHALDSLSGVQQLMTGGDVVSAEHVKRILQAYPDCRVINCYGPTENTTCTCCYTVSDVERITYGVPVGFPINNTRVYVLDPDLNPVPVGVAGELMAAGAGLARGYLSRPDLTAERFVPNPYAMSPGERMYRSGDLVRWHADGLIEFLGRNDNQLKIRGFRIELGEIEMALKEHRRVQDALVTVREQGGDKQLLGYVVARQDESEQAETQSSHIVHWRELYESTYRQGATAAGEFNITGWNSSYTGDPIPAEEMRIWVDETVGRIRKLRPRRVLEIGCGTGLLLTRLATGCESYLGLDFSAEVLAQLGSYLATRPELAHIELRQGLAHELSFLNDDSVDLVILNSIVQYFPNVNYLVHVLAEAVRVTRPAGNVFVGDVRSLPLLSAYHTSVQLHRSTSASSPAELRQRIFHAARAEEELVIDAALFTVLARRWKKVGRADAAVKAGAYDNELSRFRYDVTLRIGDDKETIAEPEYWLSWNGAGTWQGELQERLAQKPGSSAGVRGFRDHRVASAVAAARLLHSDDEDISSIEQLRTSAASAAGEDPNSVAQLARQLGVEYCWRGFAEDGIYDLVFNPQWQSAAAPEDTHATEYHGYANAPAQVLGSAKLGRTLHEHLRQRLPEYMTPAAIMVLTEWPLAANGKIDRRALPTPERHLEKFRAPRNPREEILCEIFAEVLGLERIGIEDNFFDLGGHSLMATRLVSRIGAALGAELTLRALFECPTVAQLAPLLDEAGRSRPPLVAQPRPQRLPLSHGQQRLWFIHQLEESGTEYNMPEALRLRGKLDGQVLEQAINAIVARHEVLRTHFVEIDGEPAQVIAPGLRLDVPVEDLSVCNEETRMKTVMAALRQELERPFDLARGPLLRVKLLKLGDEEHILLRTFHHIVSDGWSHGVFTRELMVLYEAFHEGRQNPLPPLPLQYADYALWQRAWLDEEAVQRELNYWKQKLAGIPEQLALPQDHPRPPWQTFAADSRAITLPAESLEALKQLGQANQATLYMTLLAVFAVLLQRYSGQDDIVVGSPIANRQDAQLEQLIGLFVNSLVVRIQVEPRANFDLLLQSARSTTLDAYAHQDVPFERLVEMLSPQRSLNVTPIFQVLFALQNAPLGEQRLKELSVEPVMGDTQTVRVDVEVHAFEHEGAITFYWLYKRDLFDPWRMEQMSGHYVRLLNAVLANPKQPVGRLDLLSVEQKRQVLVDWNQTQTPYDRQQTIAELFQEQVRRTPNAAAVSFKKEQWTYAELDRRANQLAHYLRKMKVGPEVRVGACFDRGPAMIVSFLGILKAGGTYVPLDSDFPPERLAYMVQDTGAPVIVTQTRLRSWLPKDAYLVDIESESSRIAEESDQALERLAGPENGAYIIYTSGSSGRPKGVVIEQRNMANMVRAQQEAFAVKETDSVLQFFSFSFDVSIFAIFMALGSGAKLVLGTREQLLPGPELLALLEGEEITIGVLPPIILDHLPEARLPKLRQVIVGGEAWSEELLETWGKGRRFFNSYGPTETTVQATVGECRTGEGKPSIGRPIVNARVYLLDEEGEPVPAGVAGELYIGGDGVGRGYLDCALTAEKYVPDGFSGEAGSRLYRTGDWARWLPDGRIDLLGRKDEQVKIRGYRVELGEIESVLGQHPSVLQCAVLARQEDRREKRLVAYVVAHQGRTANAGELRNYLKDKLPDYMAPAHFVMLEELPLNSSGKVDRHALPAVDLSSAAAVAGRAPRNPEEEILCQIFAEVLGLERAAIDDNFFDLGGHSLMATRLASRVRSVLGVELPLRTIFESPTVAGLSSYLCQAQRARTPLAAQPRPERVPMSYAQQRLWFLDQLEGKSTEYNMPEALRLRGELDHEALERALAAMVERHEVLRTHFAEAEGGQPVQIIEPYPGVTLPIEDLSVLDEGLRQERLASAMRTEREQPFDLSRGPLLRTKLLKLNHREHVLLRNCHHIVTDGWSQGIFNRELMALYEAFHQGQATPLEPLVIQYADFALWQRQWLDQALAEQLSYWKDHLTGIPDELALPKDRPRPPLQTFAADACTATLPVEHAAALKKVSQQNQATLYMTLLSAFALLLHRYSGQDDIVLGSPIANRQEEQLEKLMGFFVNSLVLRVRINPEETFSGLLAHVRATALDAYRHQDLPFERLVEELSPRRSLNKTPIYQVMFLWQNAPMAVQTFRGLEVEHLAGEGVQTHFDLEVQAMEHGESVHFQWVYNRDLFDRWRIEQMSRHFEHLLCAAVAAPQTPMQLLPMLAEEEKRQLLVEWNATEQPYPAEDTMQTLFEQQAARTPGAVAVVSGGRSLTYLELNQRANQLAHYIKEFGVGPEVRVGVCLERSPEMLVGLLGILKAGGAYVPLDPKYPAERLSYMLEDSQSAVVLTQQALLAQTPPFAGTVVQVDAQWSEIAARNSENPEPSAGPRNLAYVIYTSGSTGKPKGVAICHSNVATFIHWSLEVFRPEDLAGVLFSTSICFDLSVFEMFVPLACGGSVLVAENALELANMPNREQVKLVNTVPSALRELARMKAIPSSVRTVNSCGEVLGGAVVRDIYESSGVKQVVNLYGPSEDTVYSTYISLARSEDATPPPIGKPIANSQAHVLDPWLEPVAVGVVGDLYLGGAGLGRGYLNRPELSADRFVPDPFSKEPGGRLYRTGDLARWAVDGNLEFMGRADEQVKIRGFRIELGEIECVLQESPEVEQAVVVAREDDAGEKRLVAYVVARAGPSLGAAQLREYLKARVPEHMTPSHFVFLDRLPLTQNGKVNRRALPQPQASAANLYVAPHTALERLLAGVWEEALGVERVGLDDNFFDLGGHSLLVARVRFSLRQKLQRNIALIDFFTYPTVRALAARLEEGEEKTVTISDSQERAARQRASLLRRSQGKQEGENQNIQ
ncbi:MAG TPA: non-ribosomal peptide synthase/polyketide synthase [Candidatus Angelobacter sp.]